MRISTRALILIKCEAGAMEYVNKRVNKFEKVQEAAMLTGPYDIMVMVEAEGLRDITQTLVGEIRDIVGVEDTVTNIVMG